MMHDGGGGGGGGGVGVDSPSAFERSTIKLYKMTDLKPGPCCRRIVLCFRRIALYLKFFEICAQCQFFYYSNCKICVEVSTSAGQISSAPRPSITFSTSLL